MDVRSVRLAEIDCSGRFRQQLGDLTDLKESIRKIGLLHPVVITPDKRLVSGQRRMEAARQLGLEKIDAHIASTLGELSDLLRAERDENTCRKNLLVSEAVALGKELEEIERLSAKRRQGRVRKNQEHSANFAECAEPQPDSRPRQARDAVGDALGMSGWTYEKAKRVVDAAEQDPDAYADLVPEMDASGKVDPSYKKLKERQSWDGKTREVSWAMRYAEMAIAQLRSIRQDDPERLSALKHVSAWIDRETKGEGHGTPLEKDD